jgi:PBSX family phage terminase large subunit
MPLSAKQILSYQEATRRYNIWVGATRSGKTHISTDKFAALLKFAPAGDAMILGVSRDSIQRNVLNGLYKRLGFGLPSSKTSSDRIYGRTVWFIGANDEGATRRIQGSTLALAYVDEAPCIPYPVWKMLQSRLSVPGAQLLGTANPEGPHHWFKKEIIDRSQDLDIVYWNFTLDDNPTLDAKFKEDIKKEYSGVWYKRLILGEWAVSHGLIYDSYDEDNEFDKLYEPASYYIVGVDYGTSNATAAVLAAIAPNRWPQIRIEEEYYYDSVKKGRQKTDAELADDLEQFVKHKNVRSIFVDPSAASLKVELRNKNLPVRDAKNDIIEGIKTVSKFIAQKTLIIHKRCKTLRECLQTYSWDPKAADQGEDKPLKHREHICDSLRYCLFSAFPSGDFSHSSENLTIDEIRKQVFGEQYPNLMGAPTGGYF